MYEIIHLVTDIYVLWKSGETEMIIRTEAVTYRPSDHDIELVCLPSNLEAQTFPSISEGTCIKPQLIVTLHSG